MRSRTALEVEKRFLEGTPGKPGIKAVLDARSSSSLDASYGRALESLDECQALLKVGPSPFTVGFTAFTIVLREGLEAVVILAALLAGFRGPENAPTRRRLAAGAWLAIGASLLTFILGHYLVQSLSRHGEYLEAIISLLAVFVLLMVTNWVFHKYYWVQWNARLRTLSRKIESQASLRWEAMAMVGVGFLTIYREGFEVTLFLQSLILEGGWAPALSGLAAALAVIAGFGFAIFWLGAKLPYRKLLVLTGLLVVSILMTFLGSTVRLFQTVGWMSIHPVGWLDIPPWMGLWLGLYPSYEGILIPCLGLGYVAGAWLWVKWSARRSMMVRRDETPFTNRPLAEEDRYRQYEMPGKPQTE
jgi:high-affinity iron transporter